MSDTPEQTNPVNQPAPIDHVVFYKDSVSDWRWRRVAHNGEIVGASSEGYKNFKDCFANFKRQSASFNIDVEA